MEDHSRKAFRADNETGKGLHDFRVWVRACQQRPIWAETASGTSRNGRSEEATLI
jgi:hypothetical protein